MIGEMSKVLDHDVLDQFRVAHQQGRFFAHVVADKPLRAVILVHAVKKFTEVLLNEQNRFHGADQKRRLDKNDALLFPVVKRFREVAVDEVNGHCYKGQGDLQCQRHVSTLTQGFCNTQYKIMWFCSIKTLLISVSTH